MRKKLFMRRDRAPLKHSVEAISNIEEFVEGLTKEENFVSVKSIGWSATLTTIVLKILW